MGCEAVTPAYQTIFACPKRNDGHDANGVPGNCFQAAVATLLDLPLSEVPHFVEDENWYELSRSFVFKKTGLGFAYFTAEFPVYHHPQSAPKYVLVDGKSPRGDFHHVVVADALTGEIVHDPHPSGAGLLSVEGCYAMYELEEEKAS